MSFAENLVYLRQHYGVTQEELAEQLGVSRQTVGKWEAGTNYPEMDKLLALCDLFRVSMDDLVRGAVSIAKEGRHRTLQPPHEPLRRVHRRRRHVRPFWAWAPPASRRRCGFPTTCRRSCSCRSWQ